MFQFQYIDADQLPAILQTLAEKQGDVAPIAGGTELLLRIRAGSAQPRYLLNVDIPSLRAIQAFADWYAIGASAPLTQVVDYFRAAGQPYEKIAATAESVGACQTRNIATIGGNICTGNASSDMATILLALGAEVEIASVRGMRRLPLDQFFIRNRVLALEPDELVTQIWIPRHTDLTWCAEFIKVGKRRGHVIAALNVGAAMGLDADGVVRAVRLAAGTLAPTPIRLYRCEDILLNQPLTDQQLARVADMMMTEIQPRDSLRASKAYRQAVAPAVMQRAIRAAAGQEVAR